MAASSKKAVVAAFIGNGLVAITKFIAAAITGSAAMLTEAFHSVADTGNQALLLWGLRQTKKPPDDEHPFGYGKELYFWSFVVAILLFAVGAGVSLYEGINHAIEAVEHPEVIELGDPTINYIVIGLALVFEGYAWWTANREFRKSKGDRGYLQAVHEGKDPALFVVLFEDSAAGLGLVVAGVGIFLTDMTANPIYDGIAAIIIGLLLAGVALWLAVETKGLLIGEAAEPEIIEGIRKMAIETTEINKVNELLTMHFGPNTILVNLSVDFKDECDATDIERVVRDYDRRIKEAFPRVKRVFVEAEAWTGRTEVQGLTEDQEEHYP